MSAATATLLAAAWLAVWAVAIAVWGARAHKREQSIPRPRTSMEDYIDQSIYLANSHKDQR